MTVQRHGLFVGIERTGDKVFMSFKAVGKLTHADYQTVTPLIDSALEGVREPEVDCLVDLTELEGWELRAAWDDFKIGLKHGNKFRRIAIIGNKPWQEWAARVGDWFVSGESRYFSSAEEALAWLTQP